MTADQELGAGEYIVRVAGEIKQYSHFNQIPDDFQNIIKFLPAIPPGPHTHEQHEAIDQLPKIFQTFMKKEAANASRNKNR